MSSKKITPEEAIRTLLDTGFPAKMMALKMIMNHLGKIMHDVTESKEDILISKEISECLEKWAKIVNKVDLKSIGTKNKEDEEVPVSDDVLKNIPQITILNSGETEVHPKVPCAKSSFGRFYFHKYAGGNQ